MGVDAGATYSIGFEFNAAKALRELFSFGQKLREVRQEYVSLRKEAESLALPRLAAPELLRADATALAANTKQWRLYATAVTDAAGVVDRFKKSTAGLGQLTAVVQNANQIQAKSKSSRILDFLRNPPNNPVTNRTTILQLAQKNYDEKWGKDESNFWGSKSALQNYFGVNRDDLIEKIKSIDPSTLKRGTDLYYHYQANKAFEAFQAGSSLINFIPLFSVPKILLDAMVTSPLIKAGLQGKFVRQYAETLRVMDNPRETIAQLLPRDIGAGMEYIDEDQIKGAFWGMLNAEMGSSKGSANVDNAYKGYTNKFRKIIALGLYNSYDSHEEYSRGFGPEIPTLESIHDQQAAAYQAWYEGAKQITQAEYEDFANKQTLKGLVFTGFTEETSFKFKEMASTGEEAAGQLDLSFMAAKNDITTGMTAMAGEVTSGLGAMTEGNTQATIKMVEDWDQAALDIEGGFAELGDMQIDVTEDVSKKQIETAKKTQQEMTDLAKAGVKERQAVEQGFIATWTQAWDRGYDALNDMIYGFMMGQKDVWSNFAQSLKSIFFNALSSSITDVIKSWTSSLFSGLADALGKGFIKACQIAILLCKKAAPSFRYI